MTVVQLDLDNDVLPARNLATARQYASDWMAK